MTRRIVLTGVATIPLATAGMALRAIGADQPLFEIEAKVRQLHEQAESAGDIHDEADKTLCAWKRQNPKPTISASRPTDPAMAEVINKYGHIVTFGEVETIRMMMNSDDPKTAVAEYGEAVNEWERRYKIASANCRHEETEKAFDTLNMAIDELLFEASEIPAITLAGVQCKARLLNEFDGEHQDLSDSMIADLLALQLAA
jgi:hypothetical protein